MVLRYVLDWFAEYLIVPDGPAAGQPLVLTDEQAQFILDLYAVDPRFDGPAVRGKALNNARRIRRAILCRAKGHGKALALGTRLPTPTGWTTMGAVRPGDQLLDESGESCVVLAATEVMHGRPCYRIVFRDGTSIVADGDHLWPVEEFVGADKRVPRTVTTREIAERGLRYGRPLTKGRTKCSAAGVARWKSLPTPPLALAEAGLPLPPYLLGYWLGDGDSDGPRITIDETDLPEFVARMAGLRVQLGEPKRTGNPSGRTFRIRFNTDGYGSARATLRALGVLNDKHIPAAYLRASHSQRLELLRGLMDSDGSADKTGRVELTLTSKRLAAGAVELMRTLGLYPRVAESDAKLNGRTVSRRWRICVAAYADEPVFALARKVARLTSRGRSIPYSQVRTIVSVEPVESVPVRCVSVSSKSSLYLAGDGMIPTHNSPLLAGLCLVETLGDVVLDGWDADGEPVGRPWSSLGFKAKAQVVAVSEDQTGNTWDPLLEMAREGPVLDAYDIEPMETFVNVPRGRIEYTTSAAISREGFRPVFCALDQTESWVVSNGGLKLAATLRRNLAKVGGSSVETPNAWVPGEDSVAEKSHEAWLKQTEGKLRGGDGILFDHREAPPDTNPADRDSLMAGLAFAYGDSADVNGGHVSLARILEDYWDPATDPADARRFYLNQIAPAADAWTTPQEWAALADPGAAVPDGDEIALFFDGSKSLDATALIGCHITSGHVFEVGVWEPDPGDLEDQVPVREVDAAVATAFDRWSPVAFFADVREWESFVHASWPDAYGDQLVVHANPRGRNAGPIAWDMRARTYEFTMAAETCHTEITEKQFTHDGSSVVARHVANARRRPNRHGVSIGKESPRSPKKVDAAVCVIGARMVRRLVLASPEWAKRTSKKTRSGRVYGFS